MLSQNAIEYTLRHLLTVALPAEPPVSFNVQASATQVAVRLPSCAPFRIPLLSDAEFNSFLCGEAVPRRIPTADGKAQLPVFMPTHCDDNDTLCFPYDIVSVSFSQLARIEELRVRLPDETEEPFDIHNRFRYGASLAFHYGFVQLPLADEYAMLLRQWLFEHLRPDIKLQTRAFRIVPTHDIDLLQRFHSPLQAIRSIFGRDLLINRSLTQVRQSLREYRDCWRDANRDPYILAIDELAELSRRCGCTSIFFFKGLAGGEEDATYNILSPAARHAIRRVQALGMEVGVHGSYGSYNAAELLRAERERLQDAAGVPILQGRQHYLRFTFRRWSAKPQSPERNTQSALATTIETLRHAGVQHDYTLGYAEQPGFRCGTCHPYPLYDIANDRPTDIVEHPLIVMDGSLVDYLHLSITDSNELIHKLMQRCKAVEGDFVILWHNHLLSRQYRPIFEQVYVKTVMKE